MDIDAWRISFLLGYRLLSRVLQATHQKGHRSNCLMRDDFLKGARKASGSRNASKGDPKGRYSNLDLAITAGRLNGGKAS